MGQPLQSPSKAQLIVILMAVSYWIASGHALDAAPIFAYSLKATSLNDDPLDLIRPGDSFRIHVFAEDLRDSPQGIYSAYADLAYDSGLVAPNSEIEIGNAFPIGRTDSAIVDGTLNEFGGVADYGTPPIGETLLYSAVFTAHGPGTSTFELNPAGLIHHESLLLGQDFRLRPSQVEYGSLTIQIFPEPESFVEILI